MAHTFSSLQQAAMGLINQRQDTRAFSQGLLGGLTQTSGVFGNFKVSNVQTAWNDEVDDVGPPKVKVFKHRCLLNELRDEIDNWVADVV